MIKNTSETIQKELDKNAIKVKEWNKAHTETTYTKYKPYLHGLWVFIYTSLSIWIKALLTGKMSWKNIGLVLITSIPLYIIGYYFGIYVWAELGAQIFMLGHTILWGTILLLLPVNGIKFMFWLIVHGLNNSTTTTTIKYHGNYDANACCGAGSYEEHVSGGGNR